MDGEPFTLVRRSAEQVQAYLGAVSALGAVGPGAQRWRSLGSELQELARDVLGAGAVETRPVTSPDGGD